MNEQADLEPNVAPRLRCGNAGQLRTPGQAHPGTGSRWTASRITEIGPEGPDATTPPERKCQAPVDGQRHASDEARRGGGEEGDCGGDLFRTAEPAQWIPVSHAGQILPRWGSRSGIARHRRNEAVRFPGSGSRTAKGRVNQSTHLPHIS